MRALQHPHGQGENAVPERPPPIALCRKAGRERPSAGLAPAARPERTPASSRCSPGRTQSRSKPARGSMGSGEGAGHRRGRRREFSPRSQPKGWTTGSTAPMLGLGTSITAMTRAARVYETRAATSSAAHSTYRLEDAIGELIGRGRRKSHTFPLHEAAKESGDVRRIPPETRAFSALPTRPAPDS